jgi:hypothetical protein
LFGFLIATWKLGRPGRLHETPRQGPADQCDEQRDERGKRRSRCVRSRGCVLLLETESILGTDTVRVARIRELLKPRKLTSCQVQAAGNDRVHAASTDQWRQLFNEAIVEA